MIEYIFVFLLLILLVFYDFSSNKIQNKKSLLYFIGIIMILLAGLRWKTGTDWENYLYYFDSQVRDSIIGKSGFEFFYESYIRLFTLFTKNYSWVLISTACIIICLTYKSIIKYSPYPLFSIYLLYTYSFNSSGFGYRQDLAIAITTFSIVFVYKRKFLPFVIAVVIATLFHQSAIIFIVAYWIPFVKWNRKTIILICFGILCLGLVFSNVSSVASSFSDSAQGKVESYTSGSFEDSVGDSSNPYVVVLRGIANRAFILIYIIILVKNYIKKKNLKKVMFFLNLYLFGFTLFLLASPIAVVFVRFTRYFDMFFIILIPLCLYYIPPKVRFNALVILLIYTIMKFLFFLALDDKVFVPYNTIFT